MVELKKERYAKAYTEVLEIIGMMGEKYQNKIPKKLLNLFLEKRNKNYTFILDNNIDLLEQNISKEAIGILSILQLKYWCDNEFEKKYLNNILKKNEYIYQKKLKEKYDIGNIFKNNNHQNNNY